MCANETLFTKMIGGLDLAHRLLPSLVLKNWTVRSLWLQVTDIPTYRESWGRQLLVLVQWSRDVNQNLYDSLCISFILITHITFTFKTGRRGEGAGPTEVFSFMRKARSWRSLLCLTGWTVTLLAAVEAGDVNICHLCHVQWRQAGGKDRWEWCRVGQ